MQLIAENVGFLWLFTQHFFHILATRYVIKHNIFQIFARRRPLLLSLAQNITQNVIVVYGIRETSTFLPGQPSSLILSHDTLVSLLV